MKDRKCLDQIIKSKLKINKEIKGNTAIAHDDKTSHSFLLENDMTRNE